MSEDRGRSEVLAKVEALREKSGNVMSQLIEWNPRNWEVPKLVMFETQISKFANRCRTVGGTRVILRGEAIEFSETIEDVFIGAMIFGYGPVGYGPSRVGRVISENPDLIERLNHQYESAAEGHIKSWRSHTKQDKVKYFGPAFATKFAYFAARHQKAKGYLAYVDLAHRWGTEVGGDYGVDEVERAIFKLGQGMSKKLN